MLPKQVIDEGNIIITAADDYLKFVGSIDCKDPSAFLKPLFHSVVQSLNIEPIQHLKVDLSQLNYLNSAGIKEFVDWFYEMEELPADRQCIVTIYTNPAFIWQESSVSSLVYLNPDRIKKDIKM